MATYIKPNVLVFEEKASTPATGETALRPWIIGQNTQIHDRSDSVVCDYADDVPSAGLTKSLPGLSAGSVVDESSVKVYADNAILEYAEITAKENPADSDDVAYNEPGTPNIITFPRTNLITDGTYKRDEIFGSRDVEVGDQVILSAYAAPIPGVNKCTNVEFPTKVVEILTDIQPGDAGTVVRRTNKNAALDTSVLKGSSAYAGDVEAVYYGLDAEAAYTITLGTVSDNSVAYTVTKGSTTSESATATGVARTVDSSTVYDYTFVLESGAKITFKDFDPTENDTYSVTFNKVITPTAKKKGTTEDTAVTSEGSYLGTLATEEYTIQILDVDAENNRVNYSVKSASGLDSYPESGYSTGTAGSTTGKFNFEFALGRYGSTVTLKDIEEAIATYVVSFESEPFTGETYVYGGTQPQRVHEDLYDCAHELSFNGKYDPIDSGWLVQDFSITVTSKSNNSLCKNIELSIVSESGLQNQYGVQAVSQNGTDYEFEIAEGLTAKISDYSAVTIGSAWCYTLRGAYTPATVTSSGEFTGKEDDTYVITCVDGGTVGGTDRPHFTVRLLGGDEFFGPVELRGNTIETAYGVTFTFSQNQVALGETWLCQVDAERNGAGRNIVLADTIPNDIRTYDKNNPKYLNVKFCVQRDVEITGVADYVEKKVTIPADLRIYQSDIREASGVAKSMKLIDATITVSYNEWLAAKGNKLNYVRSIDDIDDIPGPLVPENALKYGVYKALANANGELIVYTAVVGNDIEAWADAIDVGANSREVYSVVPLTQDIEIQNYVVALINSDSGEETCSWKNCYLNTVAPSEINRVGLETSLDKGYVYANIGTDGVVEITSKIEGTNKSNADLSKVVPGDALRVVTGPDTYTVFTIDGIVGDTLRILNPPKQAIDGFGIEVWHTFTREEQVEYVSGIAQSFANRRVILVWPDVVGEGNYTLPGTFLCAALAGLAAGSLPNQGLTRVSINGFDDLTRASEYFTETQLNKLAGSGVWIVTEDKDGTVYTRHAITTSTVDLQEREEMFTRILDYIAFQLHDILDRYIGVTNVADATLESIAADMNIFMRGVSSPVYNAMGPLATDYNIVSVEQDDLLKDRVNVVVQMTLVKAINNIVLRIQAS